MPYSRQRQQHRSIEQGLLLENSNVRETRDGQSAVGGPAGQLAAEQVVSGRYRIVRLIGSGGMGQVYEVEHIELGQRSALKLLRPDLCWQAETVKRFHREARAMAQVRSSHVARIMDFGALETGVPFFVMELLHGSDLSQLLAGSKPLSVGFSLGVVLGAARGLGAVHDAGLVHRDIKPANLFVTRELGGEPFCKVLDFGVIKSEGATSTTERHLVGTLRYMAPEQLDGRQVDARTDIYALSAVLYECLAGRPPHEGDRLERVLFSIMNEAVRPLVEIRPEVPPHLSSVVARGLAHRPQDRFRSAHEFADALRSSLVESRLTATAPSVVGREHRPRSGFRRFNVRSIASVASVVMAAGIGSVTLQRQKPSRASPSASARTESARRTETSREVFRAASAAREISVQVAPTERKGDNHLAAMASETRPTENGLVAETRRRPRAAAKGVAALPESRLMRVGSESTLTAIDPHNPYDE